MDNVYTRTAADLEKKYNLTKLAESVANIEVKNEQIIHLQNELDNIKKTIIINLGDTLQESVSLWFYEGEPTTENEPYINWETPNDHIDDLYYDQGTGYVYKYTSNGWQRQYDTNLISALSLTNAELDVSQDNERKVYLTKPTPPYSSGDWWIQEDGTLMICQLGKTSGNYEENDFVVSTMYTSTIATKQENTIEVIHGQVVQVIEDASGIQKDVTELQTLVDINGTEIGTLSSRVSTLQSSTSLQIETINQTLENGVEKLTNSLVKIDSNGINTSKTDETFNTQITNKTFEVKDGNNRMGLMGFDTEKQKMTVEFPEMQTQKFTCNYFTNEGIEEDNLLWSADYYNGGAN